jgi:hypothetical protein
MWMVCLRCRNSKGRQLNDDEDEIVNRYRFMED